MIIDHKSPDYHDLKLKLQEIVSIGKISSIEMICEYTGTDEDSTRELLEELVGDGIINGSFSDDGSRFFLSEVKVSDAPVLMKHDEDLDIKNVSTKAAKTVSLIGFTMIVVGWIFQGLTSIHQGMENAGIALFMIGLLVMTAGCIQFSRYNPPEKLR
ncbi:MAG: hypothetical protein ACFFCT_08205 [Candidatus Odinarchaeota archaeon]